MTSMRPTRTPFIILPVWVLRHVGMTPTILVVYLALAERSLIDRKPPKGVGWVMAASGLGRSAVYGALATLREIGALVDGDETLFLPVDDHQSAHVDSSALVDYSSAHMDDSSAHADRASTTEPRDETPPSPDGDTDAETFAHFWAEWPDRNGKKLGKAKAFGIWKRLSMDDRRAAWRGARNYAAASRRGLAGAMDAFRWLRAKEWEDWQTPAIDRPGRNHRPVPTGTLGGLLDVEFDDDGNRIREGTA